MSAQRLMTISDFKKYLTATSAQQEAAEKRIRAKLVNDVLHGVTNHMQQLGLQAACERVWRVAKGSGMPYAHRQLVRETLMEAGWVRGPQGKDE